MPGRESEAAVAAAAIAVALAERRRLLSEACAPGACDTVGDVVDGRYLLVQRLGVGAVGTVWVARDLVRCIDVAVKLLRAAHLANDQAVADLEREAELAARMLSPHIVRVLSSGRSTEHGRYVVYELLEGEDLGRLLACRRRLAIVEARRVVVHACRALARAHALGVLHRDIKPSNLFLSDDGHQEPVLKVLDFGLAQRTGLAGDPSIVVGTLEYIAPEVLFAESEADARTDLYALAVVAYECLTGRVPFEASSVEELVVAYASKEPPKPSSLRPGLPRELDAWFERALARDPGRRFASAKEMSDALDEAIAFIDRAPGFSNGPISIEASSTSEAPRAPSATEASRAMSGTHLRVPRPTRR